MDARTKAEVDSIITDLNRIISDLNQISSELNQFKGIGAGLLSDGLREMAKKYSEIRSNLNNF